MSKRRNKRFRIIGYTGNSSFVARAGITPAEAMRFIRGLKRMSPVKFRIRRSYKKGFSGIGFTLGLVLFIFCLALANATPELFSLSASVENLIRIGFLALGIFGLIVGLLK